MSDRKRRVPSDGRISGLGAEDHSAKRRRAEGSSLSRQSQVRQELPGFVNRVTASLLSKGKSLVGSFTSARAPLSEVPAHSPARQPQMKQVRSNGITTSRQVGSSASSRRSSDARASTLEPAALPILAPHQGGSLALLEQSPQSHATSSLAPTPYDGEDGDRDQPIDLTEEDDVEATGSEPRRPVAGPSRLRDAPPQLLFAESFSSPRPAALASRVRTPRRPDLSIETSFQPEYRWLNSGRASPALSSTSSQDSRRSRTSSSAGRGARDASAGRSNLRAQLENSPRKTKAGRRRVALDIFGTKLNNMKKRAWTKPPWLANKAKLAEQAHAQSGGDTVEHYQGLLSSTRDTQTLEASIRPKPKPFDPSQSRLTASRARLSEKPSDITDILERVRLQDEEQDRKVEAAARPKIPSKLSPDRVAIVERTLANRGFKTDLHGEEVVHSSIERLRPSTWLNDEVINGYGMMIQARSAAESLPSVHYFTSYWYGKVKGRGYKEERLARWTKKVDLFAKDLILFPINVGGVHWTCGAIDLKRKTIEYYDSMNDFGGEKAAFYKNVRNYLSEEHMNKKNTPIDLSAFKDCYNSKSPQQNNGSDCGVFACQTLEARSRGLDLVGGKWEFSAADMPLMRQLMIYEIAKGELAPRW